MKRYSIVLFAACLLLAACVQEAPGAKVGAGYNFVTSAGLVDRLDDNERGITCYVYDGYNAGGIWCHERPTTTYCKTGDGTYRPCGVEP